MVPFREICNGQKILQDDIYKIGENCRKKGSERTTAYLTTKIGELKTHWRNYQTNDKLIKNHADYDPEAEYIFNNEYTTTYHLYGAVMEKILAYLQATSENLHSALTTTGNGAPNPTISRTNEEEINSTPQHLITQLQIPTTSRTNEEENKSTTQHTIIPNEVKTTNIGNGSQTLTNQMVDKNEEKTPDESHQITQHLSGRVRLLYHKYECLQDQLEILQHDLTLGHPKSLFTIKMNNVNESWSNISKLYDELMEKYNYSNGHHHTHRQHVENVVINTQIHIDNMGQLNDKIKIQPLKLPTFNGNYTNWITFHDLYINMIHNNSSIGKTQKMQYLKNAITGDAAKIISHLTVSEINYDTAWELMVNRYHNKRLLVSTCVDAILNAATLTTGSAAELKTLHDNIKECIHSLNNLAIDTTTWDAIIVQVITRKIDIQSMAAYEQQLKNPKEVQKLEDLLKFIEARFQSLETVNLNIISNQQTPRKEQTTEAQSTIRRLCEFCRSATHSIFKCITFRKLSPSERMSHANRNHLCKKCLQKSNHKLQQCKQRANCQICELPHNTLLHLDFPTINKQKEDKVPVHTLLTKGNGKILLATAIVRVKKSDGTYYKLRALIDQGSEASFISEKTTKRLNLRREKICAEIAGIGETKAVTSHSLVNFTIQPNHSSNTETNVTAYVLHRVTNISPSDNIENTSWDHLSNLVLADPDYTKSGQIDILLGSDIFSKIIQTGLIKGPEGTPIAQQTTLGWIISGIAAVHNSPKQIQSCVTKIEIDTQLQKFWEIENTSITRNYSSEEQKCEDHFKQTHKRLKNGRYVVRLPFKNKAALGNSKQQAFKRLEALSKRMHTQKAYSEEYTKFIKEYMELGHMIKIQNTRNQPNGYYIPHHAVMKPSSTSTKFRVVFDASAKTSSGKSLNDELMVGPVIQQSLMSIILRWRKHRIVFTADISKMYRQILVDKSDQEFQRILWKEAADKQIQEYKLATVTYGTACAPFLAIRTLHQLALDEESNYPRATQILKHDFYVDDVLSGGNTINEAITMQKELKNLLQSGGFQLRKWSSNCSELLNKVTKEDRETSLPLEIHQDNVIKTLGIIWNPGTDTFEFRTHSDINVITTTKRELLSEVSQLFDPLGWISPVTIKAKIMFQKLWLTKTTWNDPVPKEVDEEWKLYKRQLPVLQNIKIPRWINYSPQQAATTEIHGFSDASTQAFSAVVYTKTTDVKGNAQINLITSKTRVAPIKQITLPRLELCGATLLAKLIQQVQTSMEIPNVETYAWTDSTIVLAWIKGEPGKWKTFVANRVTEINSSIKSCKWHHVKSSDNPADIASRGVYPKELVDNKLWWNGPNWLKDDKSRWPIDRKLEISTVLESLKVKSNMKCLNTNITEETVLNRFSSLQKLLRITVYCIRFKNNCSTHNKRRIQGWITTNEIHTALIIWIKNTQSKAFQSELYKLKNKKEISNKSQILSFNPFLDKDGIIRVGGRIQNSLQSYDEKHPILLPQSHHLTQLIITDAHQRCMHGGTQLTMAYIRRKYWIIKFRQTIRFHIHKCVTCFHQTPKLSTQLMGILPSPRVQPSRPFLHCGIDFAGPIEIRAATGRGKTTIKGYIAVFVCFTTKAIHLEAVSDLSANAFLAAYNRFTGRRGICSDIYSDCGTNFVGASKKMITSHQKWHLQLSSETATILATKGTNWHFIPPGSPHFGGLWESGVKSVKHHLRRTMDHKLTFEELTTTLVKIESCLNSRPLTALSNDPEDITALTPGHFLIGEPLLSAPEPNLLEINTNRLTRWELIQKITQDFWKRWSEEYLTTLQQRQKWKTPIANLEKGQLVLIKNEQLPPSRWLMGRILELHPGADGLCRVATLKCKSTEVTRNVNKLCILPIDDNQTSLNQVRSQTLTMENPKNSLVKEPEPHTPATNTNLQNGTANRQKEAQIQKLINNNKGRKRTKIICNNAAIEKYTKSNLWQTQQDFKNGKISKENFQQSSSSMKRLKLNNILFSILSILLYVTQIFGEPILPYRNEPFVSNPGLYFSNLGNTQLINGNWNIIVYFNLENYNAELTGFKTLIEKLEELCKNKILDQNICKSIQDHLKFQYMHCEQNNQLLFKHTTRTKRGLLNVVGNMANQLFGVLDNKFAEKYEEDIAMGKQNQQYMLELMKNQTSITEATENILKKNLKTIYKQFSDVEEQLNQLINLTNKIEINTKLSATTNEVILHMISFQRLQDNLLDVALNIHKGRVSPNLLTPVQLSAQLTAISHHLPQDLNVPEGDTLLDIYKLLSCKISSTANNILFQVTLPLIRNDIFQLIKIIPIPTPVNGKLIWIKPTAEFLAINLRKDNYHVLHKEDITHNCQHVTSKKYICHVQQPLYNQISNISKCELLILNHQPDITLCNLITTELTTVWIPIQQGKWIYILNNTTPVDIICGLQSFNIQLFGYGFFSLDDSCILRQNEFIIYGHTLKNTIISGILPNISQEHTINKGNHIIHKFLHHTTPAYEDISNLHKLIEQQKISLERKMIGHHIHHYAINYGIIITIIIAIIAYGIIRCHRNQQMTETRV